MKYNLLIAAALSLLLFVCCHSDYYSDGHRKGSWGAYKDFDGPKEWQTYCMWMEEYTHELTIVDGYYIRGLKDKTDSFCVEFEKTLLKRDWDSLKAYEKYYNKWD